MSLDQTRLIERLQEQLQAAKATMKAAHDTLNQGTWAPDGLVQRAIDMLTPATSPGAGEGTL